MRENKSALDGIGEEKTEINLLVPEVLIIIALNAMEFFSLISFDISALFAPFFLFTTRFYFLNAHVFVLVSCCLENFFMD